MKRSRTALCAAILVSAAPAASRAKVVIDLDYSLDANFFFDSETANGRAARAALERAAQAFSDRIVDNLTAITPSGGNTWTGHINHPATGLVVNAPATSVAANVIKVYAGGQALTPPEIASGGAGTATAVGSVAFVNNANSRGQAGALATPKTDFAPWGGSITFDEESAWYFGLSPAGIPITRYDFITVATHELAHLLGFSASQASWANKVSGGKFTGANATAANGGVQPAVGGSHWSGLTSTAGGVSQPALMNDSTPTGVRRRMTVLDWGAMADVGWVLAAPGDANADGRVNFTDFQIFELGFNRTNARWSQGDFNEDGTVNHADFTLLFQNYGMQPNGSYAPVAAADALFLEAFAARQGVPEPATGLLVVALAAFASRGRARRATSQY